RRSAHAVERRQSLTVGQPEIQQQHIERFPPHALQHFVQTRQPLDLIWSAWRLLEHFLDQARVTWTVFHEPDRQLVPHHDFTGKRTVVNQKSSIDRTTSRN